MPNASRSYRAMPAMATSFCLILAAGCATPFDAPPAAELRASIAQTVRRELGPQGDNPPPPAALSRHAASLDFTAARLDELNAIAGPAAYEDRPLDAGADLLGQPAATVSLDLAGAITAAVRHNLIVEGASFGPAISRADVDAANAVFDWVLFADAEWNITDAPFVGTPFSPNVANAQDLTGAVGVRKELPTGGSASISNRLTYTDDTRANLAISPDPSNRADIIARIDHPLLRGAGRNTTLAEVRLAENAQATQVQELRRTLIDRVTETERAYWNLIAARRNVQIRQRLLERGIEVRDVLKARLQFDVRPAEYSDAVARVETRRADVIRALNDYRKSSDALKALMNAPDWPVGSETLVTPIGEPPDEPVTFSLFDAMASALQHRPEIEQAILGIEDREIRLEVAENARLPRLDLAAQAAFAGLDRGVGDAYGQIADRDFVSYLLGLEFEQPIGNRPAEAAHTRARLVRMQALTDYRRVVQNVFLQLKGALRDLETNYTLIEQTRTARLAAAENLRTLIVQKQTIQSLTPEFLNLEFTRQDSLAAAELAEIRALADYNIAIADFDAATGLTLDRRGIIVSPPDADALLPGAAPAPIAPTEAQ
ncbi:MAG: TolC family protein [Phycisphaerales bacterium]|nr:TolC family protein [Phycisphaerales bacterium]